MPEHHIYAAPGRPGVDFSAFGDDAAAAAAAAAEALRAAGAPERAAAAAGAASTVGTALNACFEEARPPAPSRRAWLFLGLESSAGRLVSWQVWDQGIAGCAASTALVLRGPSPRPGILGAGAGASAAASTLQSAYASSPASCACMWWFSGSASARRRGRRLAQADALWPPCITAGHRCG